MQKKGEEKTIACDFYGVIHGYSKGWQNGEIYDDPVPGAKEGLEQLVTEGYRILIYTTRCNKDDWMPGDPNRTEQVKAYLAKHEIPYHEIHEGGKPKAYLYLDDRNVSFKGDWNQSLKDINNFKTWNRPDAKSSAELEAEQKIKRMICMDKEEKSELIALAQFIEEGLQKKLLRVFKSRSPLPAYGEFEGSEWIKHDFGIVFSLKHLKNVADNNLNADIVEQVALVFSNEYVIRLFKHLIDVLDLNKNSIKSKTIESIVNYAERHENGSILCGPEDIMFFERHEEWIEGSLKDYVPENEPYLHGFVGSTAVYVNPVQLLQDKGIYFMAHPLIDYGIKIDRETITKYNVKDDDIEVTYNPADLCYRLSADIDSIVKFELDVWPPKE